MGSTDKMSNPPLLDIVVLTYKSDDDIRSFWTKIVKDLPPVWRLNVRDNGGTHDSLRELMSVDSTNADLRVFYGENVGFAAGINSVVAACEAPYVAIINPDVSFSVSELAGLLEVIDGNRTIAAISPRLTNAAGERVADARSFPSLADIAFRRPTEVQAGERAVQSVDWICGAFMVWRREQFVELGGFDESYFLFWEDTDLCRRAPRGSIFVLNSVGARHTVGGSHGGSAAARLANKRSRRIYATKYYGIRGSIAAYLANFAEFLSATKRKVSSS